MFSVINWYPLNEVEKPKWSEFENIPSATQPDLCCLALNIDPSVGSKYVDDLAVSARKNRYRSILGNLDLQRKYGLDSHVDFSDFASVKHREMDILVEFAEKLGMSDLPDCVLSTEEYKEASRAVEKLHQLFYTKAVSDNLWQHSHLFPLTDVSRSICSFGEMSGGDYRLFLDLATCLHEEAFYSKYLELNRKIQENRVENNGSLQSCAYGDRIKFIEFVEWADSIEMALPDGFPRKFKDKPVNDDELKKAYRIIAELLIYLQKTALWDLPWSTTTCSVFR